MNWIEEARAKAGRFVTIEKIEQGGALQARADRADGVAFYFRVARDGQEVRARIGLFDAAQPPRALTANKSGGWSLAGARARAVQLAVENQQVDGGLAAQHRAQAQHRRSTRAEKDALADFTVQCLFDAYVNFLEQRRKTDVRDARNTLRRFLALDPALADKPAHAATAQDFVRGLRSMTERGLVRQPGKVRSYAHAAYRTAMFAATDPSIPARFEAFQVTSNPLATIRAIPARADKRPLSVTELRTFWRIASETPGTKGALMRLHLLLGGQRIAQFLRLKREDVRGDHIVLFDYKGRRPEPRRHVLPLPSAVVADLALFTGAPFLFSTDGGQTPIRPETLYAWERDAIGDQVEGFKPKRLRSGVETLLASLGISRDLRAQLQSHGLGGVQARHYDDHDYLPEKRTALQTLFNALTE
jgi:integrase